VALLSTNHKCTYPCIMLFREEPWRGVLRWLWGVLRHAIHQSDACGRWRWCCIVTIIVLCVKTFESTLVSVIKVNKHFLYVLSNVLWYYTHLSIICVKLWSWHTYEMHLVFFRKNKCDIPLALLSSSSSAALASSLHLYPSPPPSSSADLQVQITSSPRLWTPGVALAKGWAEQGKLCFSSSSPAEPL
jgi:hypothetical protein